MADRFEQLVAEGAKALHGVSPQWFDPDMPYAPEVLACGLARGVLEAAGVPRLLEENERLRDLERRLAAELESVGVTPGRNPDGVNDDPEKAGLMLRELRDLCKADARVDALEGALEEVLAWAEQAGHRRIIAGLALSWDGKPEDRIRRLQSLADWLVALDEPDATERRTVTLTQIIEQARSVLDPPGGEDA